MQMLPIKQQRPRVVTIRQRRNVVPVQGVRRAPFVRMIPRGQLAFNTQRARGRPAGQGRRNPNRRRAGPNNRGNGLGPLTVAPLATTRVTTNRGPRFGRNGIVTLSNQEYIMEINGSTGFNVNAVSVNPGLVASFPWLSKIANQFEKYRWRSLAFEYKTAVSAGGSTGQIGKVVLVADYDARDPLFAGMQQALDYKGAKDAAPWKDIIFQADTKPKDTPYKCYYTRSGAVPSGTDVKTYDQMLFELCTSGQNDANNIGYLRVSYTIDLIDPKINAVLGGDLLGAHYVGGGSMSAANIFGTAPVQQSGSNMVFDLSTEDEIVGPYNPQGTFLVAITLVGTVFTSAPSITAGAGASNVSSFFGGAFGAFTTTDAVTVGVFDFTAPNPVLTIAMNATTVTASQLVIQQISSGMSKMKTTKEMTVNDRAIAELTRQVKKLMEAPVPFVPLQYEIEDIPVTLKSKDLPLGRPLSANAAVERLKTAYIKQSRDVA